MYYNTSEMDEPKGLFEYKEDQLGDILIILMHVSFQYSKAKNTPTIKCWITCWYAR